MNTCYFKALAKRVFTSGIGGKSLTLAHWQRCVLPAKIGD